MFTKNLKTLKKKPYIGITGFMSSQEVKTIIENTALSLSGRLLMVGVLASSKTIEGIPNKWPGRYPANNAIHDIFLDDDRCLNLIHYNTKEPDSLASQLTTMTALAGKKLNGFQLNIAWPDPSILDAYKKSHPEKVFVLQIGSRAFEMVNNSPEALARKVNSEYAGIADYVLLDPSGGLGIPFDSAIANDYLSALSEGSHEFGLGVAGGLSSSTLNLIEPLIEDYPSLSIDAEGRLRSPQPEDALQIEAAIQYVQNALELFSMPA